MQRKLQRIILDLQDLAEERYIDSDSNAKIQKAIMELEGVYINSTED